jgi:hypothetical protein
MKNLIALLFLTGIVLSSFAQELACVYGDNGKYGFIDEKTGDVVILFKYNDASYFSEGVVAVRQGNKWGILDIRGNIKVAFNLDYSYIDACHEGLIIVRKSGKSGYIDTKGTLVIPLKYDDAFMFKEGKAIVKLNNTYYRIDKTGKIISVLSKEEFSKWNLRPCFNFDFSDLPEDL